MTGLNDEEKKDFIEELNQYARVYISSEDSLPKSLEKYRLNIPYEMIHHVMYYAQMVISDGATMASEAVVLGTHAVRLSPINCGTFKEQEERYGLLKWFHGASKKDFDESLSYIKSALSNNNLFELGKNKRRILLEEMVDCNEYFIKTMDEVINNVPKKT